MHTNITLSPLDWQGGSGRFHRVPDASCHQFPLPAAISGPHWYTGNDRQVLWEKHQQPNVAHRGGGGVGEEGELSGRWDDCSKRLVYTLRKCCFASEK